MLKVERIVSGGQTGVDRAALDFAIQLGLDHGGWCPRGRLAEDGPIPDHYLLHELDSTDYADRTRQNVIDSDGTLILYTGKLVGGTLLTFRLTAELRKPYRLIRLDRIIDLPSTIQWIEQHDLRVLNVAGPRASTSPEIYSRTFDYLQSLFSADHP